jgi:hypothetical protein
MGSSGGGKQSAAMTALAEEQFEYYKEQQEIQQGKVDDQRDLYEAFEFTNPFADTQNPFANIQTEFENIYGGAQNMYAGAQNAYAGLTNQYAGMENLYEGMENRFEDMTVDMRAADFQSQQMQQQQANIMQGLRGAAGTSGVAGLAQAMAGQGALQTQQIAAGISQQERQNQMLAAQEGARIDQLQRGAGMQLQQLEAGGAQQLQAQQAAGAMQTQQMQMAGASEQQQLILGGAAQAQALGVSQINQQAQGQWMSDMAIMQGEAGVQAAEWGRESTIMGMEYGLLAGANQSLSGAMGNQMSAMGMQAQMANSQAQANTQMMGTGIMAIKLYFACIPKGTKIDKVDGSVVIEDIKPGDIVIGYNGDPVKVLQKHEYLEGSTAERFYKVKFKGENDRVHEVNVCDMHRIKGERSKDITENVISKEVYNSVEFSYDLLTEDEGYRIDSIPVNSMIEEMSQKIAELKNK